MSIKSGLRWLAAESLPLLAVRRMLTYAPTVRGRATRLELISTVCIVFVLSSISFMVFPPGEQTGIWQMLTAFQIVLTVLPLGSTMIRRLQDTGRTWNALFIAVMPYVGIFILAGLLLWEGDSHENAFGPPPR